MKETIFTIPINEAYETDCECPLCELERKLEAEAVEYSLGPAMMEPDFRIDSNDKGFCNKHFSLMFKSTNKLPLALVLDTHLDKLRKELDCIEKSVAKLKDEKNSLFKKSNISEITDTLDLVLDKAEHSCVVCEKVNHTMERYIDVLLYMWTKDDVFKEKFSKSKGVCLKHFKMLVSNLKTMKDKDAKEFLATITEKEIAELSRIQEDIHKFTLKFDYRNKDMDWGSAKDAPLRTIEKISGYLTYTE